MKTILDKKVTDRAQRLLMTVVERYIRDGQPVGSKTLAEECSMGLSSASIRNVLAELEDKGYLRSPHTSAGRIPTAQGYRFFVNSLLTTKQLAPPNLHELQQQLNPDLDVSELVRSASNVLSELTRLVGVVMLPRREHTILRHIEFLPLGENRILVILVLNEHEVQNRIIYTDKYYNLSELQQAANYLNSIYAGQDVAQVRRCLFDVMQEDRAHIDQLMQTAVEMADKALGRARTLNDDYVVAGQNHLFDLADGNNVVRLRQLFEAFTQKQDILHLLDQCLGAEGIQIFIGEESGYELFDECSLVTAPYSANDQVVGVLGVIGPTRMAYDLIIPIVDVTAKLLSVALNTTR